MLLFVCFAVALTSYFLIEFFRGFLKLAGKYSPVGMNYQGTLGRVY